MTTKLTVKAGTNGTLKQTKTLGSRMMRMTASVLFVVLALTSMSFTQDDTTKKAEEKTVNQFNPAVADSCCTVTFATGSQQIVITNANAFAAEVRINNMDINTWVNSLKAYTYKRVNFNSIGLADNKMDVSFTVAEKVNRKMAVAYSKSLQTEAVVADNDVNDQFTEAVAAPLFGRMMQPALTSADASMDMMLADDADNKAKVSQFRKQVTATSVSADENVDLMIYAASIEQGRKVNTTESDILIDTLINKPSFSAIRPAAATSADKSIDGLLIKIK
jgi:hypothetical protein